jgi:alpha-beta hydrolase superfamily lysophospholipase
MSGREFGQPRTPGASQRIHRAVDVTPSVGTDQQLTTTVTICFPPPAVLSPRGIVPIVFAFPGGGYPRSYFDMDVAGHSGYSMAEHFGSRGIVVVACDYLGSGESTLPQPYGSLTLDLMTAANHAVVTEVLGYVQAELDRFSARLPTTTIGFGHSLGAGLVTVQQTGYRDFDGLILLGRPIGGTHIPAPPKQKGLPSEWCESRLQLDEVEANSDRVRGYYLQRARTQWQRYLFYWDDVPESVIRHDELAATTLPVNVAREIGGPTGPGAQAAALVDVPVFLGFGERDLSQDPLLEPRAYRTSQDIQLFVLRRSAHCHNLASSRAYLWDRICGWIYAVSETSVRKSRLSIASG